MSTINLSKYFLVLAIVLTTHLFLLSDEPKSSNKVKDSEQLLWANLPNDLKINIKIALKESPKISKLYHNWLAVKNKYGDAMGFKDPMINVTYMIEPIQTRTGHQVAQIALMQQLPWFGVRQSKGNVVNAEAELVNKELNAAIFNLVRNIKTIYSQYAYLNKQLNITEDNYKLLKILEPIISKKLETGGKQSDLLKLQIAIDELEQRTVTIKSNQLSTKASLDSLIGKDGFAFSESPVLLRDKISTEELKKQVVLWQTLVNENNPSLSIIRQKIEVSNQKIIMAKKQRRPNFEIGLRYLYTNDEDSMANDAGKDPYGVSIGMNIPLWSKKYKSLTSTAKEYRESAIEEFEDELLMIDATWQIISNELFDFHSKIRLYGDKISPKAKQIIDIDIKSYESDSISIQDLINSIRDYLKYEDLYWYNIMKWEQELAKLEATIGGNSYEIIE